MPIGCGGGTTSEPPNEEEYEPKGDPTVEVGFYDTRSYRALSNGGEAEVIYGSQGGTWMMPALRTQGMAMEARIEVLLRTDDELLGEVSVDYRFDLASDGWLEISVFPIPVSHEPPRSTDAIDDLYGADATLTVRVTDEDGREAESTLSIVLIEEQF